MRACSLQKSCEWQGQKGQAVSRQMECSQQGDGGGCNGNAASRGIFAAPSSGRQAVPDAKEQAALTSSWVFELRQAGKTAASHAGPAQP